MSKVGTKGRSFLPINKSDLIRILNIARTDQETFFRTYSEWAKLYKKRFLCIALCQGAAKHYIDGTTGINDFDVYTFYKKHPLKNWYAKRIKSYDFGNSKFGKSVDKPNFIGRRVDCLSRSIEIQPHEDVKSALLRYLENGHTETARFLSAKAVVLLEPDFGQVLWPVSVVKHKGK